MKDYTKLESACYFTWKLGYKPEKAVGFIAKMLGYKPDMISYKLASRKVILTTLRNLE